MRGLYALPPGVDFAAELVAGLLARMQDRPPEALAAVTIHANSGQTLTALQAAFQRHGALLLPRMRLIADLGGAPPIAPLARRLELARLVDRALAGDAAGQSVPALARSLSDLMAEMQLEGLGADALTLIDAGDHAAHWQKALDFLQIAADFHLGGPPQDREARQRAAADRLAADWAEGRNLPLGPVIVAGSTGSHGATRVFMQAVAALPEGAVILPGFDPDTPADIWDRLTGGDEDHPQARFAPLIAACGMPRPWTDSPPPDPARNRLVSLALRPAPVTDRWIAEGPALGDLPAATAGLSLIEADHPAAEAGAIAALIRAAVDQQRQVTLIAADRTLTRRVTAALDRWGIRPDDSAGVPLPLSAAGLFLRHIADLPGEPPGIAPLLTLLKHPLTATGAGRDARRSHLLHTRELELHLRRNGPAFPDGAALLAFGDRARNGVVDPARQGWAAGIAALLDLTLPLIADAGPLPLDMRAARHRRLAEAWAAGPGDVETSRLYAESAGEKARAVLDHIAAHADRGPAMTARDFAELLLSEMQAQAIRSDADSHPLVRIRGPREARVEAGAGGTSAGMRETAETPAAPLVAGTEDERRPGPAPTSSDDALTRPSVEAAQDPGNSGQAAPVPRRTSAPGAASVPTTPVTHDDNAAPTPPTPLAPDGTPPLVILGGLNEGGWPQVADPDPWLSRPMRRQAGLTLPERRIGLAAHDFQIAIAAPQVVLTRARRNDEAETIPSRWLNRLLNLTAGLPGQRGPEALAAMRDRGNVWLDHAATVAAPREGDMAPPAPRPSVRPPAPALDRLSVTAVSRLIRDPYAIYAEQVLRLRPLDPLKPQPDAAERGNVLHDIIRRFLTPPPTAADSAQALKDRLMEAADAVLAAQVPWPSIRMFWRARIAGIADRLAADERARLQTGGPLTVETRHEIALPGLNFRLTAKPDRIDRLHDGTAVIYDYKSGTPPTRPQILAFDKQLPLEAAMAERGVFGPITGVADLRYVRLGGEGETKAIAWDDEMQATWDQFTRLIAGYLAGDHGFTARRALERVGHASPYDQLSRFGEWAETDAAVAIKVGDA